MLKWKRKRKRLFKLQLTPKLLNQELKEKNKMLKLKKKLLRLKLKLRKKKKLLLLNKEERLLKLLKKLKKLIKENLNLELMLPLRQELLWLKNIKLNSKNN